LTQGFLGNDSATLDLGLTGTQWAPFAHLLWCA